jgi:hypothetical protein
MVFRRPGPRKPITALRRCGADLSVLQIELRNLEKKVARFDEGVQQSQRDLDALTARFQRDFEFRLTRRISESGEPSSNPVSGSRHHRSIHEWPSGIFQLQGSRHYPQGLKNITPLGGNRKEEGMKAFLRLLAAKQKAISVFCLLRSGHRGQRPADDGAGGQHQARCRHDPNGR